MDENKLGKVGIMAKSAEQKSAHAFKKGRQGHQQKCAQLDQLVQFKDEYEARLHTMCVQGMAARQLLDYRRFLRKLNEAIDQQLKNVKNSEELLGAAREEWLSKSRRNLALDQLLERQKKMRLRVGEKAEQKIADEETLVRRTINNKP